MEDKDLIKIIVNGRERGVASSDLSSDGESYRSTKVAMLADLIKVPIEITHAEGRHRELSERCRLRQLESRAD